MRTPVIDGQSIEQFIPANLRGMFYNHPIPQYKYAIHNGLDPYGFSTNGLVLYLPLWALKGSPFKSVDAYKHTATPAGTTKFWTPLGWDLAGADEYIDLGTDTFSPSLVTLMGWFKTAVNDALLIDLGGRCELGLGRTSEEAKTANKAVMSAWDGDYQSAESTSDITDDVWHLVAGTADGTNLNIYVDGGASEDTQAQGSPVYATARAHSIARNYGGTAFLNGLVGEVWIYSRALSAGEIQHNYLSTRWRYQ